MRSRKFPILLLGFSVLLLGAACRKKAPPPPPPPPPKAEVRQPPPPPPKPLISMFRAEPSVIERGQATTLLWLVTHATDISIDQGIGTVPSDGRRQVTPSSSTTYTLTAKGPGGTALDTASVRVAVPPPPPPPPKKAPTITELMSSVHDAYFDFDKYYIREDARSTLTQDANALMSIVHDFPKAVIVIEGHCDERGSAEYNLALGDRRAHSAEELLINLGVPAGSLKTISYGKERPQCTEQTEACWQLNRRVHFSAGPVT